MTNIYDIYSLITGWAVGFYLMAGLIMYTAMAFYFQLMEGWNRSYSEEREENEITGDYFDDIENTTTRRVGHFVASIVWGAAFALSHVFAYAVLSVAITRSYILSASTSELVSAGADFHVASMVYAWLIAAGFAVATIVAFYSANMLHSLVFAITQAFYEAAKLTASVVIKKSGWLVEPQTFISFITMTAVTIFMVIYIPSLPGISTWPLTWATPALSASISAYLAVSLWRQHRDAETLIKSKAEVINEPL